MSKLPKSKNPVPVVEPTDTDRKRQEERQQRLDSLGNRPDMLTMMKQQGKDYFKTKVFQ